MRIVSPQFLRGVSALYAAQFAAALLPLVALPYVLRRLGAHEYGLIVFAQSAVGYAVTITDYGFNFTAARDIALAREDRAQRTIIFWSTLSAKLVLSICGVALLIPFIFINHILRENLSTVGVCSLLIVGTASFPQWYFQGLEKFELLSMIGIGGRLVGVAGIFAFVHSKSDTQIAATMLSVPALISGAISAIVIRLVAPVPWRRPRLHEIKSALRSGWHVFVSNAAGTLHINTNSLLLGVIDNVTAVANYSIASKIAFGLYTCTTPIYQFLFPKASLIFLRSRVEVDAFVMRLMQMMGISALGIVVGTFLLSHWIVGIIGGRGYSDAASALRILSILPLLLTFTPVFSQTVMINAGLAATLSRIYIWVAGLNLVLMPPLTILYGIRGCAWALVMVECVGPALMLRAIRRAGYLRNLRGRRAVVQK